MIKWEETAVQLGYASPEAMWEDFYCKKRIPISKLATQLDVSRNAIREALERYGVKIRGRGGANNTKIEVTDELIERIRKADGSIAVIAKELGVSYTTLYKRLYRVKGFKMEDIQPKPAADAAKGEA